MSGLSARAAALSAIALFFGSVYPLSAQVQSRPEVTRVSATLNGVFSPRGYFNILVPLMHMPGVRAAKLDLKPSQITIDFAVGANVSQEEIQHAMVEAGYRPGHVVIEQLPEPLAIETGAGWIKVKHPGTKNPWMRWLKENF